MRVRLVSFVADNRWSGMGKWSHRIADALSVLGDEPSLWFADDFPAMQRLGRWAVIGFPIQVAFELWRRRDQADLVVIHEPAGVWYGLLRRWVHGLPPMVVMCHNVESKHFREMKEAARLGYASVPLGSRLKAPLTRLWQSDASSRLADHVLCLSSVDRRYLIDVLGVPADRVTLMINGVEAPPDEASTTASRAAHRVLFVGGWLDVKGRRVLPPLWRKVLAQTPNATLTLVGTGAEASGVLGDFQVEDRPSVTVVPRIVDPAQMAALYATHDLFLMPSLSEGSSLALLEAMAAGLPVVAARVGGIPDVVRDETIGVLFESMNPAEGAAEVCRVLADSKLRVSLSEGAQRRARELSWESTAATLEEVARRLLDRPRCVDRPRAEVLGPRGD
jgi:glycosyltransferase involved in cell wall biosynthesis